MRTGAVERGAHPSGGWMQAKSAALQDVGCVILRDQIAAIILHPRRKCALAGLISRRCDHPGDGYKRRDGRCYNARSMHRRCWRGLVYKFG